MTAEEKQNELELNFHTDMPVGEILRRTRNHYGQDLLQVESILRIRASQLDALEKGDISQLPGRVYAIGFVRSYSEYLGLDGDKMVHLFKEQSVGRRKKPELHFPAPVSDSKIPNLIIIGSCLFGIAVLLGFITFLMLPASGKNEIPPVPVELTKSQLNQAPSLVAPAEQPDAVAQAPAPAETPEPAVPTNRITLEITDSSWVEIRNADGAAILRQVLKPGDVYIVPPDSGLVMATGNAGGIVMKIDGKNLGPLGEIGQIKRKVVLDPVSLSATLTPPEPPKVTQPPAAAEKPPPPSPLMEPPAPTGAIIPSPGLPSPMTGVPEDSGQQPPVSPSPRQPLKIKKKTDKAPVVNMFETPN